ncbi:MAG: PQQ-binding-like beta-propeller repeat protein, partial [Planctomycetota bacterium]
DWKQFRGPQGLSRVEFELPTEFGGEDNTNIAWQTTLKGRAVNGPVVVGKHVIATSSSGPKLRRLHVFSLDNESGKVNWERRFWATGRTLCHPLSAIAAATPSTDGKRVFVLFSSNDLFCLDLDGNLLWMRALNVEHANAFDDRGMASSTWLANNTLVVQVACAGDSFVLGLDPATGKNKWRHPLAKTTNWATPADVMVGDKKLVMIQSADELMLVEPESGKIAHSFAAEGNLIPSPAAAGDIILLPAKGLTAVRFQPDEEEGEELWQAMKVGAESSSPVADGKGSFLVIRNPGILTRASLETGKVLWKKRLKGSGFWSVKSMPTSLTPTDLSKSQSSATAKSSRTMN